MTEQEIERLMVGSVIRKIGSGMFRVARGVTRSRKTGKVIAVNCTIQRCSWTGRPVTVINRNMLKCEYEHTGVRRKIVNSPIDMAMRYEIRASGKPKLSCCAVRGIP